MKRIAKLYYSRANGAGKTTSSFSVYPEIPNCNEYVKADSMAKALSPFNLESVLNVLG